MQSWIRMIFCLTYGLAWPALATPTVLTLNDPTAPPYTTDTGDGILDVLVGEAVKRCGYTLKLVQLPAERGLINANEGIEDGDLSRIAGLEKAYPNLVRVPEKIFDMDFVALTRKSNLQRVDWTVLESVPVSHIKGWKIFERNLTPATHVTSTTTPEQMFDLLRLERVEMVLYSRWMGLALARRMKMTDVRVVEPPLAAREMFIYLHKKHQAQVGCLAESLRALKREGRYQQVYDEKLKPYRP